MQPGFAEGMQALAEDLCTPYHPTANGSVAVYAVNTTSFGSFRTCDRAFQILNDRRGKMARRRDAAAATAAAPKDPQEYATAAHAPAAVASAPPKDPQVTPMTLFPSTGYV